MTILIVLILFPVIQFVSTYSVFYNSGFKYLTENVLYQIPSSADVSTINTRWILQKVDHFDDKSESWKMRYFENLKFFKPKGPVYIYLGGEGEASPRSLSAGIIYELAQETNGAMFMTEHRYYGKSLPFDIFVNVEHMKWLTSRQALADIAHLIKDIKINPIFKFSKVVVIGGSYAGNLAAWMRLLYSDLVDAAIASSGPVLAKKDFFEYMEKVNENYEFYGTEDCLDNIERSIAIYKEMLQSSEGIEELKNKFNICHECDMSVVDNQWVFFSSITDKFMSNSQYGNPQLIKDHCLNIDRSMTYNNSNVMLWNAKNNCFDFTFDSMIKEIQKLPWAYSWFYQTCTEFGYFQTTTSHSQPFGKVLPLDFYIKTCQNTYGFDFNEERVDKAVDITNKMYGGLRPNVTRVVFSNGDMDPWSTLSVLEDLSYVAPSVVIHRASHCADLYPDGPRATEEIKEAAKHIKYLIKHWIGVDDNSVA